ncbi:uncharacterized protein Tco025E_07922 [Trypanosoma conorhini]|uniref:Mucin-associated surface protein (MASP) n=1 Tax=Trypanosoma conorhini TaxID=83891 RepID=A0A3R7KE36_9TRYP|nr:uncharacterized protein Tco025E_07922 [Trypanosoma conorhini]RNF04681.1 hypothetical protein Tco025E_07922 [Trypanosoma conorhini]
MALTVRRRAVCALALLALLCGCPLVCGTAGAEAVFQFGGGPLSDALDTPSAPGANGAVVGRRTDAPVLQNDSQRPDKAQVRPPATPQCSMNCDASKSDRTSCVRCPPGVPGRSPTDEGLQAAAAAGATAHSHGEDFAGSTPPSNIADAPAKQSGQKVSAEAAVACAAGGPKDPSAPCVSGLHSYPGVTASPPAGLAVPPLPNGADGRTPSGRVAGHNSGAPAFSHLGGDGAGARGGVPGAAPADRVTPTPQPPVAGRPLGEEAAGSPECGWDERPTQQRPGCRCCLWHQLGCNGRRRPRDGDSPQNALRQEGRQRRRHGVCACPTPAAAAAAAAHGCRCLRRWVGGAGQPHTHPGRDDSLCALGLLVVPVGQSFSLSPVQ